jgi:ornithine lipid ester-linked acyl 2-hydroxylase
MFLESKNFGFPSLLEKRFADIRNEFEQLSHQQLMPWPETRLYNRGWDVFGLWAMGRRLDDNCDSCPITAATVEAIPGLTTAGFSIMAPGTRIHPHIGYTNSVLRCHLGLIVPQRCGIQVGEAITQWEEGKCLIFDDTVMHSAWNESPDLRVVLLVDFLRPGCELQPDIPETVVGAIRSIQGH